MSEEGIDLREYLHVIKKRRWTVILIFILVTVGAAVRTLQHPSVYQATARLLIEAETPKVLMFQEVMAEDMTNTEYQQTQYKLLKSPTLARLVLEKLNLMNQGPPKEQASQRVSLDTIVTGVLELVGLREPPSPLPEAVESAARERQIVQNFLKKITISPVRESRLLDIHVRSFKPEETALFANTLAETYIDQNLEVKLSASREAVRWLAKELEMTREKVAISEAALQEYKEQHAIISFQDRQNIVMQKLSQLNTAVTDAKIRRITVEAEYEQIQAYLALGSKKAEVESLPRVINNDLIQRLKVELANLETELSEVQKKFRSKHPSVIALQSQIVSVQDRIQAEIQYIFTSIKSEYEVARVQEVHLTSALEQQKREALDLNQKAIQYEVLEHEVESNRRIYNALLQRTKETSVAERLETNNIRIVDRATIPDTPVIPRKKRDILLGMLVGLFIGTILAFFLEYLDNRVETPEDVKRYLDLPFLGIIPKVSTKNIAPHEDTSATNVIVATIVVVEPNSVTSEAFRSLRTNVGFSSAQGSVLLITSAVAEEGKSGIAANLGIAMALSGKKTLIIDCDLRKPMMHQIFPSKDAEQGFTTLITQPETFEITQVIHQTGVQNLDLIPCGEIPSNPSELLESNSTRTAIEFLRKQYDEIIIDSPPVNAVTDSVILSRIVDGVVLTIRAGKTTREEVQCAKEQLWNAGATILGGVLNSVDVGKDRSYYYGYNYTHNHVQYI